MTAALVLVNLSTLYKADLEPMAAAITRQLVEHFGPAWGIVPPTLSTAPIPGAAQIVLLDNADQADALGYHSETPDGEAYARVFVGPTMAAGEAVSAVVSHEALELVADATCNLWADGPDAQYALEVCDPVEADTYGIDGVLVSNFVTPSYFDASAKSARYDYLGTLGYPFSMSPGGYLIRRVGDAVANVYGDAYPTHKVDGKTHAAARSRKRRG